MKTKVNGFSRKMPSWVKHGNKRCDISYDRNKDLDEKLSRFQHMCGTLPITLRNKTKNDTQIKFCKVIASSMVVYGREIWVPNRSEKRKPETAEMHSFKLVSGCTFTYAIWQYTTHCKYMP
jgi:hypothetical protein